jgi:hypothetical protein
MIIGRMHTSRHQDHDTIQVGRGGGVQIVSASGTAVLISPESC